MPTLEDELGFPPLDSAILDSDIDPGGDAEVPEEKPARKPRTRRQADPNKPRAPRVTSTAKLAQELADPMAKLGHAVAFTLPTVGAVIVARGEVTTNALVKFAAGHPRMLAALKRVSSVGPASEIVETLAMCLIAAQLDIGKLDPAHPIARITGVSDIYAEIHGLLQQEAAQQDGGFGGFNIAPPPQYPGDGYNEDGTWQAPPSFSAGRGAATR